MDFASIGVPAIVNNEHIYSRVVHKKNGFLCDGSFRGWLDGLAYFADDITRNECGDSAHEVAHERTIDAYASEFGDLLLQLVN